jgi:hypothetical protein
MDNSKKMKLDIVTFKNNTEPTKNMLEIKNPKIMPPRTFPNKIDSIDSGASNSLSNVFVLLSKTITIASAEVEANKIDMAIKPGAKSFTSEGFLKRNANAITIGNIMPQLILGGLK